MGTQQARIVKAKIDDKGTVEEIADPFFHHFWDPDTRLDRALEEEHYGWILKPRLEKPIAISPVFPGTVDVCANDPDDASHVNTIATQQPELVKLDVGYWGDYNRQFDFMSEPKHGPPQRNFGMIQGRDVWLCNYAGTSSSAAGGNTDKPADDSPAGKLLKYLSDHSLNVEFIMHALVPNSAYTADIDPETLHIFFPDVHLPERFPDAPSEDKRSALPDGDFRQRLRSQLRSCQHEFGLLAGNRHMDSAKADKIQKYLEAISAGSQEQHTISDGRDFVYTSDNVLAEKCILDRTVRTRSCWFYGPKDGDQKSEDGDHEKKADFALMSACPALDLATLLAAVAKVKSDGAKIEVVQLGDLYELWMGREFLYLDFPLSAKFDTLSIPRATLTLLQSMFGFAGGEDDEFQYRFDEEWLDGKDTHAIKRYPFHQWQKSDMIKRHKTGWNYYVNGKFDDTALANEVPADKLARAKARLAERAKNVEGFSLPMPGQGGDKLKELLTAVDLDLDNFKRTDGSDPPLADISPAPQDEILWHSLVFTLFDKVGFRNIHGNHDGYRSDPLFAGCFSYPAVEWISCPGIWVEHGHRWDEFNRDGCAIGAGVTNMVYYHNKSMLASDRGSFFKERFMPQDQKCFMPGAAQWYLLVNMTDNQFASRDGGTPVLPFGVFVSGHTHHPDLCTIRFEKEGSWFSAAMGAAMALVDKAEEIGKQVEEAGKKVEDLARKAADAADKEIAQAKAAAEAAVQRAEAAVDKAKDLANAARDEAVSLVNKAGDAAKSAAKSAGDLASKTASEAKSALKSAADAADRAKSLAGALANKVASLF